MTEKTSTLPTMIEMTSMYLFGQLEKPNNLLDENLIRPKDLVVDYPVKVNINEYMTDGAGRFVNAKSFAFVSEFFDKSSKNSKNLEAGKYTKSEIIKLLDVDKAWIGQTTAFYDDGKDNLLERAYIWGSVSFMVNDDAVFVIDEDGNRFIENFAIVPYSANKTQYRDENGKPMDNFDFTGGGWSQLANSELKWKIDPSEIGRKVNIKFDWDNIDTKTLTNQDFENMSSIYPNVVSGATVGWDSTLTNNLIRKLWDTEVIQFLDEENRIILYGTQDNDKFTFNPDDTQTSDSSYGEHYFYKELLKLYTTLNNFDTPKGIVFIAGSGNDNIVGTIHNDRLIGGKGIDSLDGGKGFDRLEGGKDFDLYHVDNGDTVFDEDGKGVIFFNGGDALNNFHQEDKTKSIWYELDKENNKTGLKAEKKGNDLIISNGDDSQITIENYFQVATELNNGFSALNIHLFNKQSEEQPENHDYLLWRGDIRPESDENGRYKVNWTDHSQRDVNGFLVNGTYQAGFNDVIYGQANVSNRIYGLGGNDSLQGGKLNDVLIGGDGDDLICGVSGSDLIFGDSGNDFIFSNLEFNTRLRNSDKNKWVPRYVKEEDIYITSSTWGVYKISGGYSVDSGNDTFYRWQDNEITYGDVIYGGSGNDYIGGSNVKDVIYGDGIDSEDGKIAKDGDDYIEASGGDDLVYGGNGNDTIYGDSFHFVEPSIFFYTPLEQHGNDIIYGGVGNDQLIGGGGNDHILGEDGDDIIYGDLSGGGTDEQYEQIVGEDFIDGGSGNDTIYGGGGDDVIYGSSGDDIIYGDNKRLTNITGNDYLDGGDGDDKLIAGRSDDVLIAGKGNDTLDGGEGNDLYIFNSQDLSDNDTNIIIDEDGVGIILIDGILLEHHQWTAQSDQQWQSGKLKLQQTDNDLILTSQNFDSTIIIQDYNNGDLGLNLPTFNPTPTINNHAPIINQTIEPQTITTNQEWTFRLPENMFIDPDGDDLSIKINDLPDWLTFDGNILTGTPNIENTGNLKLNITVTDPYNDTATQTLELNIQTPDNAIMVSQNKIGSLKNDLLIGNDNDNIIRGNAGDDEIYGMDGNDTLYGGIGNDVLYGGNGSDILNGGIGDDTLYGGNDNDTLNGDAGNDILKGGAGDDVLNGGIEHDTLHGGVGNDILNGGLGNDIYIFNKGDGHDSIFDSLGNDTLKIGANLQDLWFAKDGKNINISIIGSDDVININNGTTLLHRIETIELDNGNSLNFNQINNIINTQSNFEYNPNISGNLNEQMIEFNQNNGIL